MNVFPARPRIRDLVFEVFGRPLHPELFQVFASRQVCRDGYRACVRITPTGHVLCWENEHVLLTEVADSDRAWTLQRRLLRYRLRGEHTGTIRCMNGVTYRNSIQVESLPPEIFQHTHDEIVADGARRGLLVRFAPKHRLAPPPLGFATLETKPGCLFLTAFHTYPEEHAVVKSQTLIEL